MKYQSPMIKRINGNFEKESYESKLFKRITIGFALISTLYFGQGVLKGFGEIENQEIARKIGVPAIEQSYGDYLCLGAKNIAGRIFPPIK